MIANLPGVVWNVPSFEDDESRREWHERKMRSKEERAEVQRLALFGEEGGGIVEHVWI